MTVRSQLDAAASDQPVTYEAFRTGLTFSDVYRMLWERRWKRRRTVLGKWREIKQDMYAEYLRRWDEERRPRRSRRVS